MDDCARFSLMYVGSIPAAATNLVRSWGAPSDGAKRECYPGAMKPSEQREAVAKVDRTLAPLMNPRVQCRACGEHLSATKAAVVAHLEDRHPEVFEEGGH